MIRNAYTLLATEAVSAIASGSLTSVQLVTSCLARIKETDGAIKAWVFLDPDAALAQAAECDRIRNAGMATGPLHGIPVGLKDIIDTAKMPTQRGTPIFAGRQTEHVARLIELLREAGAVIMGKTVTTELAFVHANETRNPHNLDHTPVGRPAGLLRRLRPNMCRSRSGRRPTVRLSVQRRSAAHSGSNLRAA